MFKMNKIAYAISAVFLVSCTSVLTDIASFKDPDFDDREPVKVMALVVNNTTMQNINRVQFALKGVIADEKIDVKFLDHYSVNPPTRNLSEDDLKDSLIKDWNADAMLFINVISETGKIKGVDGDLVDAEGGLKEKGKSDKYTTIAYGKYTASLMDTATWRTIWKADLISIDEKFKDTNAMYGLAAKKIIGDLLNKKLLTVIKDKNNNNITAYDLEMRERNIKDENSGVDYKANTAGAGDLAAIALKGINANTSGAGYMNSNAVTPSAVVTPVTLPAKVSETEWKSQNTDNVTVRPVGGKTIDAAASVPADSVAPVVDVADIDEKTDVAPAVVEAPVADEVFPVAEPIVESVEKPSYDENIFENGSADESTDADENDEEESASDIFADAS